MDLFEALRIDVDSVMGFFYHKPVLVGARNAVAEFISAFRVSQAPLLDLEFIWRISASTPSMTSLAKDFSSNATASRFSREVVSSAECADGRTAGTLSTSDKWGIWTMRSAGMGRIPHSKSVFISVPFRPIHRFEFTTAAINIVEPGKSWKGKGWNRVGVDEAAVAEDSSLKFDCIPDLEEKLMFLETCGLGSNQLQQMRKRLPTAVKNTFLKLGVKRLLEVATFLDEEVGVQRKDFGNLLFTNPYIAGSSLDDCLRPKIDFFLSRGISKEQLSRMVIRCPQILTYSLEKKLLPIENKLLEVGLKVDEIAKVFVKYPAVFGTGVRKFDRNIKSLKEGGITEVAKAIFKIPQIMSLSLENKFEQVVRYLQDELHLEQSQTSKIINCQVLILSFSVRDNIRPKVEYFSKLGLRQEDIARLVVKYPNVFSHSLENSIKPKVMYLINEMHLQASDLISFPHYLSYSLQGRIIPRHEYVMKHGLAFRLSSLLTCNENVYLRRYGKPDDPPLQTGESFTPIPASVL